MHPSVGDWGGCSMSLAGHSWAVVHILCDGWWLFINGLGGHSSSFGGCEGAVVIVHGQSSLFHFVEGGWSGCSLLLVGFCGLWADVLCVIVVICGWPGICLDGGQFVLFVGGHACSVWWVVVVCGSLGWTSHIVSGSAVVVCGWSYSFHVMVGSGHGWVCSLSFVDFDRGWLWSFVGGHPCSVSWWVVGAVFHGF